MFKLEKVFQNDDRAYIFYTSIIKSIIILISFYSFSILENNTIYDLLNFEIYKKSNYYIYSILLSIIFLILNLILIKDKEYKKNFLSFLKNDFLNFIYANLINLSIFFILDLSLILNKYFLYSIIYVFFIILILKIYFNHSYDQLKKKI